MTRRTAGSIAVAVTLVASTTMAAQQVFRSGTSVVIVDVLVRDGRSIVSGLTTKDFRVFDEGIPQTVDEVTAEQLPIDLTLLIDSSGSTMSELKSFQEQAARVASLLRTDDRVRVIAFATGIREIAPLQPAFEPAIFDRALPTGETALNDALVHALYRHVDPGRRHLIVAFTDGKDTSSVTSAITVNQAARRANAVLHLVIGGPAPPPGTAVRPEARLLKEAAGVTSGELHEPGRFGSAVEGLAEVFSSFRQSYVLRYRPQGVLAPGWHALSVRLTDPVKAGYTVTARRGYFAER
jgi:VWFA-related protein